MIRPKAIIFDLDGTLFDSEKIYSESLKTCGIDPLGKKFLGARQRVKERLGPGNVSARNRVLYFKAMLTADGSYSPSALLALIEKYETAMVRLVRAQWLNLGRDELISRVVERYPTVLLTNENTRTQILKLSAIDPTARYFKNVISSEEIGSEKPARKMFEAALETLGAKPCDCAIIGDDLKADIEPARELDIQAIWNIEFSGPKSVPLPGASGIYRIQKLSQLPEVLDL